MLDGEYGLANLCFIDHNVVGPDAGGCVVAGVGLVIPVVTVTAVIVSTADVNVEARIARTEVSFSDFTSCVIMTMSEAPSADSIRECEAEEKPLVRVCVHPLVTRVESVVFPAQQTFSGNLSSSAAASSTVTSVATALSSVALGRCEAGGSIIIVITGCRISVVVTTCVA